MTLLTTKSHSIKFLGSVTQKLLTRFVSWLLALSTMGGVVDPNVSPRSFSVLAEMPTDE